MLKAIQLTEKGVIASTTRSNVQRVTSVADEVLLLVSC